MSRTKASQAAVRTRGRAIPTNLFFVGAEHEALPVSPERISVLRPDHEHIDGEFWKLDIDMQAVVDQHFESFSGGLLFSETNLYFTGKTRTFREVIEKTYQEALELAAQRTHTQLAQLLFRLRVADAVKWAVEFAAEWAEMSARTRLSNEYVAVTGEGFQATAKLADQKAAKAGRRKYFRKSARDFVEPFVRGFHGKPGAGSKLDRDIAAREHRDRRVRELTPSRGKQKAMELAKKETMAAFELRTTKTYRNAMTRGGSTRRTAEPKTKRDR